MRKLHYDAPTPPLAMGESAFRPLTKQEGVEVTLGPHTHFFDRPGRSVCKWTGTKTIPRQSPHLLPPRSWLRGELAALARIFLGGGDVKINMIVTSDHQREILLTAGDGNVVEKIDIAELAREGAQPLLFLQPAYLCSSASVDFHSVPCNASNVSWSRAPYVYQTSRLEELWNPSILCLSGRTNV
jgi:hypothetical protein